MNENAKTLKMEINKCSLCFDAPCKRIYKNNDYLEKCPLKDYKV